MSDCKRYTITAALPYANGPLHVGHIAGAYLPADIYVRFLRLKGKEVLFVCGSDEHGAAITIQAKREGVSPRDIIDKYHSVNKQAFADFNIDFDIYHRTSDSLHHETAQQYFKELYDKDVFEVKENDQFYDEEFGQFLADRYLKGTCPHCSFENAYGDQCENCGRSLSPTELINPVSTMSGKTPVLKETWHWYLPLDRYQSMLEEWLEKGTLNGSEHHDPTEWKKHVLGQCMSWIKDGLHARAITRDLDWGVPVPLQGTEGKVLYVWLDAPIGYISATKAWAAENGQEWEKWWMDEDSCLLHFIGKDNIVFHCIIFPAILSSLDGFVLPKNVPANEFMNLEGKKISTSRNWAIWLHEYLENYPDRKDELRYALTANMPETKDSEFTWKDYQDRVNNELVATMGNFINRAVVLTHKFFDGCIELNGMPADLHEFQREVDLCIARMDEAVEQYKFREGMQQLIEMARIGDKVLATFEPWKLVKTDKDKTAEALWFCLQIAAKISLVSQPFLPEISGRIRELLQIELEGKTWDDALSEDSWKMVPSGHRIAPAKHIVQKVEDEMIEREVARLESNSGTAEEANATAAPPAKAEIAFDDFVKLDIRTASILEAERVPKADKLLKLKVSLGYEERTVVSGIAEHFEPESLPGKQVVMLTNLAPRKIRGVESNGMILMAEDAEGKLAFVSAPEGMPDGAEVR